MSRLYSLSLLLFSLLAAWQPAVGGSVPESQRETVTSLLQSMLRSVQDCDTLPNPNVLIALRLARDHSLDTEQLLLQQLKEAAVQKVLNGENFSSGLVALYIMALIASCSDPTHVTVDGDTIDLTAILEEKLTLEIKNIRTKKRPLSNYYQVSLDVLALCVTNRYIKPCTVKVLTDAVEDNQLKLGTEFSVDTGAMAAVALGCVRQAGGVPNNVHVEVALRKVVTQVLDHVKSDGLIGNLYSTGEAIQALTVNSDLVPAGSWNQSRTLEKLLSEVRKGSYSNPQAAAQVIPSLEGRTYLEVNRLNCSAAQNNLTLPETTTSAPVPKGKPIRVEYNIENGLNHTFIDGINVTVPQGSALIKVLEAAQELDPVRFSFTTTESLWGLSLSSVRGLNASSAEKTYWQLLNGTKPLDQGIGSYIPTNGERVVVKLSRY
ncbi:transcobalamin-1-like [Mustelus asterias]